MKTKHIPAQQTVLCYITVYSFRIYVHIVCNITLKQMQI